jgi:hypothetical protein
VLDNYAGYSARYSLPAACQYFAYLRSTDGSYDNSDFINDSGPTIQTKILNRLPTLTYYVAMTANAGCPWSITFTPR